MSAVVTARRRNPAAQPRTGRVVRAVRAVVVLTGRELVRWVRSPGLVLASIAVPAMFVVLFGYVFGNAITVPGGGDYREFLMPGMFAQAMVNGVANTIAAVSAERARGVTDRLRSMPLPAASVLAGRATADLATSGIDLAVLVGLGILVGWTSGGGPLATVGAIGLLLLLRFALTWVGIVIGLHVTPEAAGAAWAMLFPFTMIANTYVAPALMPGWLGAVAEWNPISATVTATRELFGNPGTTAPAGIATLTGDAVVAAVLWPVLVLLVFVPLAAHRYRRAQ